MGVRVRDRTAPDGHRVSPVPEGLVREDGATVVLHVLDIQHGAMVADGRSGRDRRRGQGWDPVHPAVAEPVPDVQPLVPARLRGLAVGLGVDAGNGHLAVPDRPDVSWHPHAGQRQRVLPGRRERPLVIRQHLQCDADHDGPCRAEGALRSSPGRCLRVRFVQLAVLSGRAVRVQPASLHELRRHVDVPSSPNRRREHPDLRADDLPGGRQAAAVHAPGLLRRRQLARPVLRSRDRSAGRTIELSVGLQRELGTRRDRREQRRDHLERRPRREHCHAILHLRRGGYLYRHPAREPSRRYFFTVHRTTVTISSAGTGSPKINGFGFSPSDPTTYAGDAVTLAVSASDPAGLTLTQYTWNWADGSAATTTTLPTATHQYTTASTYTVQVTVRNSAGTTSTSSTIVPVVANVAPVLAPLQSQAVQVNTAATFAAFASDANSRDVSTYTWNFGDGSPTGSGNPVTHTYTTSNVQVTLQGTVSDGHGHSVSSSTTLND